MARTLSILGRNPKKVPADVFDAQGDSDYESLIAILKPVVNDPAQRHSMARAANLDEVVTALQQASSTSAADPLTTLQIFTHGRAGHALLADGTWDGVEYTSTEASEILSRRSYHVLRKKVPSTCNVYLLGCSIGARVPTAADDGPILIFDLSHMWGADVLSPVNAFYASDLDKTTGHYAGLVTRLSHGDGDEIQVGATPVPVMLPLAIQHLPITFTRLRYARSLDKLIFVDQPLDGGPVGEAARTLAGRVLAAVEPPPLLASADYRFEALLDGKTYAADVVANGTLVRLARPGEATVYHRLARPAPLPGPKPIDLLVHISELVGALGAM